jgi:hypothetical protein
VSKTASNTFAAEHDKCTTIATSSIALWNNNSSYKETPDLSSNPELFDDFSVAQEEGASGQPYIALVLKHSKASPAILKDCQILSDTALHGKYPREYRSWRNMKRRSKDGIRKIHPAFDDFRRFLMSVGAKPKPSYTLDRPNNADIQYGPTNARWASKREQNRNKGDTVIITCPKTARKWFASELAKKHGVMADTIRARRRRGWTDAELIAGHRLPSAVADNAIASVKPVTTLEPAWAAALAQHYPEEIAVLTPAQKKMLGRFEDLCRDAGVSAVEVLAAVIVDWPSYVFLALDDAGETKNIPDIPQPKFISGHPQSAIKFWAKQIGCIWKNNIPIMPNDTASPTPASADLAEKL